MKINQGSGLVGALQSMVNRPASLSSLILKRIFLWVRPAWVISSSSTSRRRWPTSCPRRTSIRSPWNWKRNYLAFNFSVFEAHFRPPFMQAISFRTVSLWCTSDPLFCHFCNSTRKKSSFVECFTISLCGIEQTLFVLNFNLNFVPTLDQLQQRDLLWKVLSFIVLHPLWLTKKHTWARFFSLKSKSVKFRGTNSVNHSFFLQIDAL